MSGARLRPSSPPPAATPEAREARAELAASVLDVREHRPVTVPRTSVQGVMRLLSRREEKSVRAECRAEMRALGIEGISVEGFTEWHEERALRTVAIAVRNPANRDQPLATLEEWSECDDDQIQALWDLYQDQRAELDPLGASFELTEEDLAAITAAAKKKDVVLLTSYGSQKLARALSGLAAPPPS